MSYKPVDLAALGISQADLRSAAQLVQRKIILTEEHQVSVQDSEDTTEFTMNFKQFATGSMGWTVNAKFPITVQIPDHESEIEGSTKELELPVTFNANLCIVNSKELGSDESAARILQETKEAAALKKRGRGRPPKQGSRASTRETKSSKSMKESDHEGNDEEEMVEYTRSIHGKRRKSEQGGVEEGNVTPTTSVGATAESVVAEAEEEESQWVQNGEFVPPKGGYQA
ncbi:hypothetical protein JCM3765_004973 [Sporobolomyces pararoseus]